MYPEEFTTSNSYYGGYLDLTGKEIAILKDNTMERDYYTIARSSYFFKNYFDGRRIEYNLAICEENLSNAGFRITEPHLVEFNLASHFLGRTGVLITTQQIMQDSHIVIRGISDKNILLKRNLKNKELEAHSTRIERILPSQTNIPPFDSPSTNTSRKSTIVNLIPTKKLV